MRKLAIITTLILLLLLITPLIYAEDHCQNLPDGRKCYLTKETYNSTAPIIKIKFHEKPVTIKENGYSLFSYNTTNYVNLSIIHDTSLMDANTEYSFQPIAHLPDGSYLFSLDSIDVDGNRMLLYVNFSIDADNMAIWVDQPKNSQLVFPDSQMKSQDFAVGKTENFNLQLELERPGSCVFSIYEPFGNKELSEHYTDLERANNLFYPTTNKNKVRIQNFSLKKTMGVKNYPNNGNLELLYIICKEENSERYTLKTIRVGSDKSPPVITVKKDPHPITDYTDPETNFSIQTDDLAVCTTKHINPKDQQVVAGISRPPGYDFSSPRDFVNQFDERLIFPTSQPKNDFKFNVTCTNMANRKSSKTITVTTNMDTTQGAKLIYPTKPINKSTFDLNVTVNFANSDCSYAIDDKEGEYSALTKTDKSLNGRRIHTAEVSADQGIHEVYIKCSGMYTIEEFKIQVDINDPDAPNIISKENTCSTEYIRFEVNGSDDEKGTGINRFYYNISFNQEGYENKYISGKINAYKSEASIEKELPPFLEDKTPIEINIWAEDKAGNLGPSTIETMYFSNSSIPACDFIAPQIKVNKTQDKDTKEWTLYIDCEDNEGGSGCKDTYAYSTHILENETCTYENSGNNYDSPLIITQSVKLCAIVYDNNDNNDTYETNLKFDYPLHCFNEKKDLKETGKDCGGECAGCDIGTSCIKNSDCADKYCSSNKTCQEPSCTDNEKNGYESDVDCGGINQASGCSTCEIGKKCKEDSDCAENNCQNDVCSEATCDDEKKDGTESDVDCGGTSCSPCTEGSSCVVDTDCETNYDCSPDNVCWLSRDLDSDGDGMPDWWEIEHGLNADNPSDASEDADGDRYTNLEEYESSSDPNDKEDFPEWHKINILGLILVILGGIALIVGILLVVNEYIKRKSKKEQREELEFQQALTGTPEPIMLDSNLIKPKKPLYSRKEEKLRQEHRKQMLQGRKEKRREIFNEFSTNNEEKRPKQVQDKVINKP